MKHAVWVLSLFSATLLLGSTTHAQTGGATASPARAHVEALASPRLEGRMTGSAGERLATDYIVAELKRIDGVVKQS